jgi:hypothetical protein
MVFIIKASLMVWRKSPDPPFSMARPMIRIGIITSGMTININTPAAKMPTSGFQAEYCRLRRISA